MENWFYYSSLRSASLQLCNAFSDIKIAKYNEDGTINTYVKVPIKYGIKEKWYYWLNQKKEELQFPLIGVQLTSLVYDTDRATEKMGRIYLDTDKKYNMREIMNPSPWKAGYSLKIVTKFVLEVEQILEQILPFFNPFIMLNIPMPDINFNYDCKVILNGVSSESEDGIELDGQRLITWNIDLTLDIFLFKPTNNISLITKIISQYRDLNTEKCLENQVLNGLNDPITVELNKYCFKEE